jgi:hypothetical protein
MNAFEARMQFQNSNASLNSNTLRVKDVRKAVRYSLEARVLFTWTDRAGVSRQGRGDTRNISPKGAYIVTPSCPPRGVLISLTIYLPMLEGETRIMSMETEGRVLRVEPPSISGDAGGFSMQHNRVALCTE